MHEPSDFPGTPTPSPWGGPGGRRSRRGEPVGAQAIAATTAMPGGWAVPGGPVRAAGDGPGGGGAGASESRSPITGGSGGRENGPEERICVVHPAMFRAHPARYLLLVLVFVGGVTALLTGLVQAERYGWLRYPGLAATLGGAGWWLWWWFFSTVCIKLEITNKRSIRQEGFIRRTTTEVLHDHVRSVDIAQGFVQRVFNVGYIGIDSAGQDGIEIEIRDIPRPYDVKAIIDRYRRM